MATDRIYNHVFTLAFSVVSRNDAENVTAAELRAGLARRMREMRTSPDDEILEACGNADDSFTYGPDETAPELEVPENAAGLLRQAQALEAVVHEPSAFDYQANACGYTVLYRGQPIGGAGTLHSTRTQPMHWRHRLANVQMFGEAARREITLLEQGQGPQYMRQAMQRVDEQLGAGESPAQVDGPIRHIERQRG